MFGTCAVLHCSSMYSFKFGREKKTSCFKAIVFLLLCTCLLCISPVVL